MTDRASVFEDSQIALEVTPGVGLPATTRLSATGISAKPTVNTKRFRAMGRKLDTVLVPGKRWTEADVDGIGVFTDIVYAFSSIFGKNTPALVPGTVGAYDWQFSMNGRGPDTPATYSIETGSSVRAAKFSSGVFTEYSMDFNSDEVTVKGKMIGQRYQDGISKTQPTAAVQRVTITGAPTGGTFTLTLNGETTAPIAYNAAASAVQTALENLPSVYPGDISVTGGPLPGSFVTITFLTTGRYVGPVTLMTANSAGLTGGTTPTATPSSQTTGVDLIATKIIPIIPDNTDIFIDTTAVAIGTTKMLRALKAGFAISNRFNPVWAMNSAKDSWSAFVETAPDVTFTLQLEADAAGMTPLTYLENGTIVYLRLQNIGGIVEGSTNYQLVIDCAASVESIQNLGDADGVYAVDYNFRLLDNGIYTGARVLVRNGMASL